MTSPTHFTAITPADLVPGTLRRVRTAGRDLLVAHQDDRFVVIENRCPHAGATLHEGPLAGCVLTCPWHGSQFDLLVNEVRRGPATAMPFRFEARESDGWVEAVF